MEFSLSDFIQSGIVPEIKLLTKKLDFSKIPISTISVQELPFDNFIQKEEMVLTTAINCDNQPHKFYSIIDGASSSSASAVVFAFKNKNFSIPSKAISYANKKGLPLFEIPWDFRFATVQSKTNKAILRKHEEVYQKIQNILFDTYFKMKPLKQAVDIINKKLGIAVQIFDRAGKLVSESSDFSKEKLDNNFSGLRVIKQDVLINNSIVGRVVLYETTSFQLSLNKSLVKKHIAFPISLWFNRKKIEDMTTTKIKNDFIWNLANENYDFFDEMVRQGSYLNFDLKKNYICIVMQIKRLEEDELVLEYSNSTANEILQIEEILILEGKKRQLCTMVANTSMKFLIYLEHDLKNKVKYAKEYIDSVEKKFYSVNSNLRFLWGISETGELNSEKTDFAKLYSTASLALQYCISTNERSYRFSYRDTQRALITSVVSQHEEIKKNAYNTLRKIMEYDKGSSTDLLNTLAEFIKSNYNTSHTARNLHIHRQSLIYRLEKIEELTGMSLKSHDDLYILETYSRIYVAY